MGGEKPSIHIKIIGDIKSNVALNAQISHLLNASLFLKTCPLSALDSLLSVLYLKWSNF